MDDNSAIWNKDKGEDVEDAMGLFDSSAFRASLSPHLSEVKNYKMNHPNRGKAIIFNHRYFKERNFDTRDGTEADVKNLKTALLKMGFQQDDIIVYNDLSFLEIFTVLKKGTGYRKCILSGGDQSFCQSEQSSCVSELLQGMLLVHKGTTAIDEVSLDDHTNNDLLMVFVLTHGFYNDKIMAFDEAYPAELIWSNFTADKCETLAEKPKIFFIVACRGDSKDRGVRRIENQIELETQSSTKVDAMAFQTSFSYVIPIWSDFLCVFSSYKGFYSYRHKVSGTWFIQAFCDQVSKTDFNKVSFTDFMTGVNGQIARTFQTNPIDLRKQTSVLSSTLTKLLYLTDKDVNLEKEKHLNKQKLETQL